jgi:hypothetical protein
MYMYMEINVMTHHLMVVHIDFMRCFFFNLFDTWQSVITQFEVQIIQYDFVSFIQKC